MRKILREKFCAKNLLSQLNGTMRNSPRMGDSVRARESYVNLNIFARWLIENGKVYAVKAQDTARTLSSRLIWCNWLSCAEIYAAIPSNAATLFRLFRLHTIWSITTNIRGNSKAADRLLCCSAMARRIELAAAAPKKKILFAPEKKSLARENLISLKFIRT